MIDAPVPYPEPVVRLLALETSSDALGVALLLDDLLLERGEIVPRGHAERLLDEVDALLAEGGISPRSLDAVAFGRGPGSFTGVRIATAAAQGLALGWNRPVIGVSSLSALAQGVMDDTGAPAVVAALDARMGEIYLGACRRGADGLARPVMDEQVLPPRLAAVPEGETWSGAGSGFATYPEILSVALALKPGRVWSDALPRAGAVARLATAATAVDDPALALPVYLRDQVVRPAGRPQAP